MKTNIARMIALARKESRLILGLMSGTSMDGLDIALCRFQGHGTDTQWELLDFTTIPHSDHHRSRLRKVFARAEATIEEIAALDQEIAEEHGRMVRQALEKWGRSAEGIDLLASHGQTVYHAPGHQRGSRFPERNLTVQLGDGDFLAVETGIITVSDFRQKHIAGGGEGAPLAPYGDILLFTDPDEDRILLNIGGIANFTFVPSGQFHQKSVSSDAGPGNTMMDAYMQRHSSQPFDQDGQIARSGKVNLRLLKVLLSDPFFALPLPRSTGPELFNLNYLARQIQESGSPDMDHRNVMATLNAFTATSMGDAIRPYVSPTTGIYVSGGGARNPLLMDQLRDQFEEVRVDTTLPLGMDPDAKEAVIFALLANESLFGDPNTYPDLGTGFPKITMGKVSFP